MKFLKSKILKPRYVYILVAAMIIVISCYLGFQEQEKWTNIPYGTTSDNRLDIKENREYKISFKITEDNFKGVYIRFAGNESEYTDEKIYFVLVDKKTGEALSEYTMLLCEEVFQAESLAKLPVENSKDKEVELYFYGKDIKNSPQLCTSKNSVEDSKLYINGKSATNTLVMSATYMSRTPYNVNAFVMGALCLLLLAAVSLWPLIGEKIDDSSTKKYKDITIRTIKNKKIWGWVIITLVFIGCFIFTYNCYILPHIQTEYENIVSPVEDKTLVINRNTNSITHNFVSEKDNLSSIVYSVYGKNIEADSKLHIKVSDLDSGEVLFDSNITLKNEVSAEMHNLEILFRKESANSKNDNIRIEIEPIDFGNTEVFFELGQSDKKSYMIVDGSTRNTVFANTVSYNNTNFIRKLFLIYGLLLLGFLYLVYYMYIYKKISLHKAVIPTILYLGILYMLVIPMYSVPDEYTHSDSAYILSNRILGIDEMESKHYGYKRAVDIENAQAPDYFTKDDDYRRIYQELFSRTSDDSLSKTYMIDATQNVGILYYLAAALGITFARLLNLSTLSMFMMGRLFNLIVFTLLIYWSFLKLPIKKMTLLLYASLPIVLQEAASFSYDSLLNGFAILFFSIISCFLTS